MTIKANVDETKIPAQLVRKQAEELLAKMPLPPGYKATFTGENQDQQESEEFLNRAVVIALFLIFLILVSLFNSVSQPFIIMSSVMLSIGGTFFGLMLYKQPFSIIMTGIGAISLAGVVVKNAIVLSYYTKKLSPSGRVTIARHWFPRWSVGTRRKNGQALCLMLSFQETTTIASM